jgi:HD-like signal output (HDOD) protein
MGVLHDIGRLAIYLKMPQQARDILLITSGEYGLLAETEQDVVGFTHMDVGEALLRKWKLPESIIEVVACHHKPSAAKAHQLETALLHIAAAIADADLKGIPHEEVCEQIDEVVWQITGLQRQALADYLEEVPNKVLEIMDVVLAPKLRARMSQTLQTKS